jgi:uncharacterized protein
MILEMKILNFYDKCIGLKGDPVTIAFGPTIGVFVGVTPIIPFHTVIIMIIGFLFRQNITAAYIGSGVIFNLVAAPLLYLSQYELERILLAIAPYKFAITYTSTGIAALGWQTLFPLLTGGVIIAPLQCRPILFRTDCLLTGRAKRSP